MLVVDDCGEPSFTPTLNTATTTCGELENSKVKSTSL
jgi:hypothetical protein